MADTKISGLSAVAAFATTQEFAVNDSGTSRKISGAQLQAAFPLGKIGFASVTASQTPITTVVDLTNLAISVLVGTGRIIRVSAYTTWTDNTATDVVGLFIMEGATQLALNRQTLINTTTNTLGVYLSVILTPTAGVHNYKLQAERSVGSGTLTMNASATSIAYIFAEDMGLL